MQERQISKRAYKRRNSKKSVFRRILSNHFEEFLTLYPEERAHSLPEKETQAVELTYEPCYDDLPLGEII